MQVSDALSRNPIDQLIEQDEDGEPINEVYLCVNELPRQNKLEPVEVILSFIVTDVDGVTEEHPEGDED